MRMSGSIESSAKRAFSCRRDSDSVTRNVVRLCMKTVMAPIMRKAPIASATMSSISVIPCCCRRFMASLSSKIRNVDVELVRDRAEADVLPRDPNAVRRLGGGSDQDDPVRPGQLPVDLGLPPEQIVLRHLRAR